MTHKADEQNDIQTQKAKEQNVHCYPRNNTRTRDVPGGRVKVNRDETCHGKTPKGDDVDPQTRVDHTRFAQLSRNVNHGKATLDRKIHYEYIQK